MQYCLFLIAALIFSGMFTLDSFALQQVAGKITVDVKPGETKTFSWTLISDNDVPTDIKISAEGNGSEFLSFSSDQTLDPRGTKIIEFTVTIPNDHPGGVELTPSLFATEFGEKGGNTVLNIQMLKIPSIIIAKNDIPEFSSNKNYDYASVEPEPTVDPEPTVEKTVSAKPKETGGLQIGSPTQITSSPTSDEKKGGGCLIATAAYGTELAPQVQLLREVRDNVFSTSSGTGFMTTFNVLYYSFSPTISDWERQSPIFKEVVKTTLTPMLTSLSILNHVNIDSEQEMLGYGIGIILLNTGMYFVAPAIVISKIHKKIKHNHC
jgi:hypothetical protein